MTIECDLQRFLSFQIRSYLVHPHSGRSIPFYDDEPFKIATKETYTEFLFQDKIQQSQRKGIDRFLYKPNFVCFSSDYFINNTLSDR